MKKGIILSLFEKIIPLSTSLIGAEGGDSCGKSASRGDPTGAQRRGGSRTARGKRPPGTEINNYVKQPLLGW